MKAVCRKDIIDQWLDGRPLNRLIDELSKMGFIIKYNTLSHIINGRNECRLSYALAIASILRMKVEEIFYLEYVE